jgi:PIN domain nuclease of toxin-antitoxin system
MDDPKLTPSARNVIADGNNELFLSTASTWEIAIEAGRGRLVLPEPPDRYVAGRLALHQIQPLPVLFSHALYVYGLPDYHRDPFDRLLVAQGQLEDMPVISEDPIFARYDVRVLR